MSASSPLSTPPLRVDHLIHDLYREAAARAGDLAESVRSDVALDDSPPTSEREGEVCSVVEDGSEAAHWGSGAVHVAEGVRASPAGTALVPAGSTLAFAAMAAAPVALGTTMVCGAANELNAGDIGNAQVQYDRMRGMLAALEGRRNLRVLVRGSARRETDQYARLDEEFPPSMLWVRVAIRASQSARGEQRFALRGGDSAVVQRGNYGAEDSYGLTKKEFATLDMKPLLETALQRTTIDKIREGAENGDGAGQLLLCGATDWGLGGITANTNEAVPWCEKASAQGVGFATFYLGLLHLGGSGGYPVDQEMGHRMIENAAAAGDARAQFYIGALYLNANEGYPNDDAKALDYYRRSAEQGYQIGQFQVAWMYENGRGAPQDYPTALLWYQKLADEGSPVGTRGVGWMYYKGWATEKDLGKAKEYFQKASEMGDGQASFDLGIMYENGEGMPIDKEQALKYYRIASEQKFEGADEAVKRLGGSN